MSRLIITSLALCVLLSWRAFTVSGRTMTSAKEPDVAAAVCDSFREPLMFWIWHKLAGAANPSGVTNIQGVEPLTFKTRDGLTLAGYKLAANQLEDAFVRMKALADRSGTLGDLRIRDVFESKPPWTRSATLSARDSACPSPAKRRDRRVR